MTSLSPASGLAAATSGAAIACVQLRLLVTTDIHMRLTGFDYVSDKAGEHSGLAGLGTLIAQARAEAREAGMPCLLLDNGDMFQGTPMGDYLAQRPIGADHPAIASLNLLEYDVLGLGNHDLDFGLPHLHAMTQHLTAPVVCTNLCSDQLDMLRDSVLIERSVDGQSAPLRVGVLSVLPKLTEVWNRHWLSGKARIKRAERCLPPAIAALRAQGADLIVLLAHMGITADAEDPEIALALAGLDGVDAIITGHTHRRFPGCDHPHGQGVDPATGKLRGVPAVMAGHGGSDLGVLDLTLARDEAGAWRVCKHQSTLMANTPDTPPLPAIVTAATSTHDTLRHHLAAPLGWTDRHLHNYFSLAVPTSTGDFIAGAKARLVQQAVAGTPDAELPLLASTAAQTAGGRDGPDHYLSIPAGPVLRRHLEGLNPFQDQILALRITGAELRNWLEKAAQVFSTLREDGYLHPLKRKNMPAFNFETVYGVRYTIDPTQPSGARIGNLLWEGVPVRDDQMFLMATNQFRASGGGGFGVLPPERIAGRFPGNTERMLRAALSDPQPWFSPGTPPWRFDTPLPVRAELQTSPAARDFLTEIAHLDPQIAGETAEGFLRLDLTL